MAHVAFGDKRLNATTHAVKRPYKQTDIKPIPNPVILLLQQAKRAVMRGKLIHIGTKKNNQRDNRKNQIQCIGEDKYRFVFKPKSKSCKA